MYIYSKLLYEAAASRLEGTEAGVGDGTSRLRHDPVLAVVVPRDTQWLRVDVSSQADCPRRGATFPRSGTKREALAMPLQVLRVAVRGWRRNLTVRQALGYGALIILGKWAQLVGQLRHLRDRQGLPTQVKGSPCAPSGGAR